MTGPVIVKGEDGVLGLRGTLAAPAGLVNVVAKMDHIVVLVFAGGVSVRVEVAVRCSAMSVHDPIATAAGFQRTVIAAGEDGELELGDIVVRSRCRLRPADGALVGRAADSELVVVLGQGLQALSLDLEAS